LRTNEFTRSVERNKNQGTEKERRRGRVEGRETEESEREKNRNGREIPDSYQLVVLEQRKSEPLFFYDFVVDDGF
jgi:hypothetical protein